MATKLDTSRRSFLAGSAAALGGLSIGIHIPSGDAAAQAATPEVNAWVVVRPDDSVVVRVARIDMGQGTVTGLAQLVAESWNATGRRSPPSIRRPGRAWRATACGGTSPPPAAAASASRMSTCARAAPPRA